MYWLWIPAVVLLTVFFLALCWYFFSDYHCCPCRKKRYKNGSSVLPSYETPEPVAPDSLSGVLQCVTTSPYPTLSTPSAPPSTPQRSPTVYLAHGNKKLRNIIFDDSGIPTLDLHGMTVPEAKSAMQGFLHRQRAVGSPYVQVITGRGIHSNDGFAKLKPVIRNIIIGEGLQYRETCRGGAYLVYL